VDGEWVTLHKGDWAVGENSSPEKKIKLEVNDKNGYGKYRAANKEEATWKSKESKNGLNIYECDFVGNGYFTASFANHCDKIFSKKLKDNLKVDKQQAVNTIYEDLTKDGFVFSWYPAVFAFDSEQFLTLKFDTRKRQAEWIQKTNGFVIIAFC